MAQSKYIQSVLDASKGRPKSTAWYREKIKEFGQPGAMDLIRDGKRNNKPFYGKLNMKFYRWIIGVISIRAAYKVIKKLNVCFARGKIY